MSATKETLFEYLEKDTEVLKSKLLSILAKQSYKEGNFILASGKESNYYIDGKQTTLHAEGSTIISILFLRMLKESIDAVGGMSVGADPLASGVSQIGFLLKKNLHAFYVRKEPKKHGTSKWIEGPLKPGMKVAILEDVVTTGGSSIKAIDKIQEFGCSVEQVLAIVDRKQGGAEAFKEKGIEYTYLFDINQVIEKYKLG
ncbi:MAG: orotate phosphoribosyltransferase [Candidatus Melainabacteria bacterium]|nr:orotate phosphoribosyltransferase [Candidatus Melainabacteria bacterium]MBI3309064.1 orotate phosphoribosyltransferase [Candidatus Melainabacteria bacterium]